MLNEAGALAPSALLLLLLAAAATASWATSSLPNCASFPAGSLLSSRRDLSPALLPVLLRLSPLPLPSPLPSTAAAAFFFSDFLSLARRFGMSPGCCSRGSPPLAQPSLRCSRQSQYKKNMTKTASARRFDMPPGCCRRGSPALAQPSLQVPKENLVTIQRVKQCISSPLWCVARLLQAGQAAPCELSRPCDVQNTIRSRYDMTKTAPALRFRIAKMLQPGLTARAQPSLWATQNCHSLALLHSLAICSGLAIFGRANKRQQPVTSADTLS